VQPNRIFSQNQTILNNNVGGNESLFPKIPTNYPVVNNSLNVNNGNRTLVPL
jgi:hypothetical protein